MGTIRPRCLATKEFLDDLSGLRQVYGCNHPQVIRHCPLSMDTRWPGLGVHQRSFNTVGTVGLRLAGPSFNQKISSPPPPLAQVDVSLSKTLNPELFPVAVSMVYYWKSLWIKASARFNFTKSKNLTYCLVPILVSYIQPCVFSHHPHFRPVNHFTQLR